MAWSLDSQLPSLHIVSRKGKQNLYVMFRLPWDKTKQGNLDLGTSLESEASAKAAKRVIEYLNDKDPAVNKPVALSGTETFEQYHLDFIKDKFIGKKKNTKDAVDYIVRAFISGIPSPYIANLTWEATRDYFDARREDSAIKGLYNRVVHIRMFMEYLISKKVLTYNFAEDYPLPSTADFYVNEIIWETKEYTGLYEASTVEDRLYLSAIWHTGMDLADMFQMKKRHIIETKDGFVINKRRAKATSPLQIIQFPLANCPAKDVFLDAWKRVKNPDDRLFFPAYEDTEEGYKQFNWSTRTRRWRTWMRIFPDAPFKTIKQMRHTFVTECISGKRFGHTVDQYALEKWMGWTPGSKVASRYYTHIQASQTAHLMLPSGNRPQEPKAS